MAANGTALVLEAIARGQAVSPQASVEMLDLLATETLDSRLPALLPPGTRVVHKTGSWYNATHDAGVVYSPGGAYVIVVLSDLGFSDDGSSAASPAPSTTISIPHNSSFCHCAPGSCYRVPRRFDTVRFFRLTTRLFCFRFVIVAG